MWCEKLKSASSSHVHKRENRRQFGSCLQREGGRFGIVRADRVGRGRLYDSVTRCSRWAHIPLVPEDFVLCSVVLGLEPRTSHVLYCTTNCVSSPPFILYLRIYMCVFMCLCRHVYMCVCGRWGLLEWRAEIDSHVFLNCSFYFLRQSLSFILNTLFFSLLPGQVVLGTFCFFLSSAAILGPSYHI